MFVWQTLWGDAGSKRFFRRFQPARAGVETFRPAPAFVGDDLVSRDG